MEPEAGIHLRTPTVRQPEVDARRCGGNSRRRPARLDLGLHDARASRNTAELAGQWGSTWERVSAWTLLGTPGHAVERLLAYRDAGADLVDVAIRSPTDHEALEAYLTETVELVRRR